MTSRLLRYGRCSPVPLDKNAAHQLALARAISVWRHDTVFSFIPKNGCSSLRYSAALANGLIRGPEDVEWIHRNNHTSRASLRDLSLARHTFVGLRCPYRRLVSAFLDKVVNDRWRVNMLQTRPFAHRWNLPHRAERVARSVRKRASQVGLVSQDTLTFAGFVALLETPGALALDVHWRPQVDFLVYESYDDVFRLEDMGAVAETVRAKSGFEVLDARALTGHGNEGRRRVSEGSFAHTPLRELRAMKSRMEVPAYERFYTPDLHARVGRLYHADVALYAAHFGADALLQPH